MLQVHFQNDAASAVYIPFSCQGLGTFQTTIFLLSRAQNYLIVIVIEVSTTQQVHISNRYVC